MEEAHYEKTVSLGDVSQPLSNFPDDLRSAKADPIFRDQTNNTESLCGAKETEGKTTSHNEVLQAEGAGPAQKELLESESVATAQKEALEAAGGATIAENEDITSQELEDTDDGDGEYLNVLELDEEPNIYIELKGDED